MSVRVRIPAYFQRYTSGLDVVAVDGATVGACLNDLVRQFPDMNSMLFYEPDDLDESVVVYVNREVLTAWDQPLRKLVADGDEISLVLMAAGG